MEGHTIYPETFLTNFPNMKRKVVILKLPRWTWGRERDVDNAAMVGGVANDAIGELFNIPSFISGVNTSDES